VRTERRERLQILYTFYSGTTEMAMDFSCVTNDGIFLSYVNVETKEQRKNPMQTLAKNAEEV
jgi:hypothetical protein